MSRLLLGLGHVDRTDWLPLVLSPSGGQADTMGPKLPPWSTVLHSYGLKSPGKHGHSSGRMLQGLEVTSQELEAKSSPLFDKADPSPTGIHQVVMGSSRISCTDLQVIFLLCFLESRCDKDLDTLSGYALCLPNLARLQTYHFAEHRPILCVEIKVKFCRGENGVGKRERWILVCKSMLTAWSTLSLRSSWNSPQSSWVDSQEWNCWVLGKFYV